MNKKANLYLSIISFVSFILSILVIGLGLRFENVSYNIPFIIRILVLMIGMILGLVFIGTELLLFIIMKNKNKLLYIGYMLIELIIAVLLSVKVPYAFMIVFMSLNLGRNLLRLTLVDKLYIPKEFNKYCKMFNIKIKDFPKTKKSTVYNKKRKTTEKPAEAVSI